MALVRLSAEQQELADRARRFVDEVLVPHEVAAERAGGRLSADIVAGIRKAAIEARLNGGRHRVEHGGQGWSAVDYVAVHEQLGRNTNGLWWWIPDAYNVPALNLAHWSSHSASPAGESCSSWMPLS